ncbi:MAG: FtsW/RodA/SpoVE family cell cycle protein [Candidatus Limnocylindrales bacterium]
MSASAPAAAPALARSGPRRRPRLRRRELALLLAVAVALLVGWASLASTVAGRPTLGDPTPLLVFCGLVLAAHLALSLWDRRTDQILLPVVALLMGISLLLMVRLPQDLVVATIGPLTLHLAELQLLWIGLSLAIAVVIAVGLRSDVWLRAYKYSWAAGGIALLVLVFLFGEVTNGSRLTLRIGPLAGQPSELLKIILVVFVAAYLADDRALLSGRDTKLGPIRLPPLAYLLPMLGMWGIALAIVIVQRDLGAALLFYGVFLVLLWVATQRRRDLILGLVLFVVGAVFLDLLFPHVQERVAIWLDPFATAQGSGFQVVRGLFALGRGGLVGTGLGAGLPGIGGDPSIPAVHTDFVFDALGEELGLAGALAILALYLVIAERGLRIAAAAGDDFRALLATGLTLVIVLQAAIIAAGNAKLIPLTGVTLPFVSYGGSSLLANGIALGLLLALGEGRLEGPPGPRPATRRERLGDAARALGDRVERAIT